MWKADTLNLALGHNVYILYEAPTLSLDPAYNV